jgi:protein-S-isoprenylcysteine O-methyltransferase Ste14
MRIQPWHLVVLVGFVVVISIRVAFKRRTRANEKVVNRRDRVENTLFAIVNPGSLILPGLYLFTPWLAFADYRLPAFAPWCGTMLMTVAVWLYWRSHVDLGLNWSRTLEVRKGHSLITQGVYRRIRHPMYASIWLWCLAMGLLLENWLAGWYALAAFAVMYFVRTPREEQMMCDTFGQEYRDYMRQTGRIFPRIKARGGTQIQVKSEE